jgi:pimeloyl-ACP methyl ester carboxylesterase
MAATSAYGEPPMPPTPPRVRPGFRGAPPPESIDFPPFGAVGIYRSSPHPRHVAVYMSGDGGWSRAEGDKAGVLSGLDTLVLGVDMRRYLESLAVDSRPCSDPGADLDGLARAAEKQLGYERYVKPLLVGYSSGATLAYAALAQAPPHTFHAGLGLGFCADFPDKHPICKGHGLETSPDPDGKGIDFLPLPSLDTPFVALNGRTDRICARQDVRVFIRQLKKGRLVLVKHLGHGFAKLDKWQETFREVYRDLVKEKPVLRAAR